MRNHSNRKRGIKIPGLNKKFTFTAILREVHKDNILAEAKHLTSSEGTTQNKWIKQYQKARLNVQKTLTEAEVEEIEDLVEKWNDGNVLPAVQ